MSGPHPSPFADYARPWAAAGWNVVHLPPGKKHPPPDNYTGWDHQRADTAILKAWVRHYGDGNIAIVMPRGVVGIDVDAYGDKCGDETLAKLEAELGDLPPTIRTTARGFDNPSGIRWYRVPEDVELPSKVGDAIEAIQYHHRYAVVPPSWNPKSGSRYEAFDDATGDRLTKPFTIDDLAWLPEAWVEGLHHTASASAVRARGAGARIDVEAAYEWLAARGGRRQCRAMSRTLKRELAELHEAGASRYESAKDAVWALVRLSGEGHHGVIAALDAVEELYLQRVGGERDAEAEWARLLGGAVAKAQADEIAPLHPRSKCPPREQETSMSENDAAVRPRLNVGGDPLKVVDGITDAMTPDERLYNYGGAITLLNGATLKPLELDPFSDLLIQAVSPGVFTEDGFFQHCMPTQWLVKIAMSRGSAYTPLDRVSEVPFVRVDGSVCQAPGYDAASRTFLVLDDAMAKVRVPHRPSAKQIKAARALLLDELFEGFEFETTADEANAVATLLTLFVRPFVPLSPLAVVDGSQMGVAKGLLADVISIIAHGRRAQPLPFTLDAAEQRKLLTSAFKTGAPLFVFDEAHEIGGNDLSRALTSLTYQDRLLGGNLLPQYPNNVTWMALGNRVVLRGDLRRRVYPIRLTWTGKGSPYDRPASDFLHPDLREWAIEHRAELVSACLTLIRAWFDRGRPRAELPFTMGSFEEWQRVLAGILSVAGVEHFLLNVGKWRSAGDLDGMHLEAHLAWGYGVFGEVEFTCAQMFTKMDDAKNVTLDSTMEPPPGLENLKQANYARELGTLYRKFRDREFGEYRIVREGGTHNNVSSWRIKRGSMEE